MLVLNTLNLDLVLHKHIHKHITLEHLLQPKKMHTAVARWLSETKHNYASLRRASEHLCGSGYLLPRGRCLLMSVAGCLAVAKVENSNGYVPSLLASIPTRVVCLD
jgi:hypothetical protein